MAVVRDICHQEGNTQIAACHCSLECSTAVIQQVTCQMANLCVAEEMHQHMHKRNHLKLSQPNPSLLACDPVSVHDST